MGYSIHLCLLDAYSGISQSSLFGWKVILPLISLSFLGSILLSFAVSHLLRTLALVFVIALLIWIAISNYFFFGMALVLMIALAELNLKITKGCIQKYSLEFKQKIIKRLLAYKFKEFSYKPFDYI